MKRDTPKRRENGASDPSQYGKHKGSRTQEIKRNPTWTESIGEEGDGGSLPESDGSDQVP